MQNFNVYPIWDINITKAKMSTLWDDKGTEYTDMYGGHAVISIGHTADRYVKYLSDQLNNIAFYSNSIKIAPQKELAEKLGTLSEKEDYSLFLCNSGAEANENAIKLASFHNKKAKIVAFTGSFHGRTSLAVATTNDPKISAPVNITDNVIFVEYNNAEALTKTFEENEISSVIFEAIQGVGGVKMMTADFAKTVRELCDQYNAVMIADCVQCGCGRSGRYFALDHLGVTADIYSMAKGIGNGFPIGGIMISPKFEAVYGMLGTTFGGNHLACAAALAVTDDIKEKNLIENAKNIGEYLINELKSLNSDKILEIRGIGLMIGIVMSDDSKEIRKNLLFEDKIFVGSAKDNRLIRILPSLTITKEHCDKFLTAFKKYI